MAARNYSSVARATTLTSGVSGASTTFPVGETTGFPTVPFTMVIDPGRAGEEVVTVTNQVGLNLTVTRGQDGTGAQPHDAGATLRHMATARDYREPAEHIALTSDVHGVTGALVGASQTQTLDNKTFSPSLTDHTPVTFKQSGGQAAPLLVFKDSSDNVTGSVTTAGRVVTPGVDSTKSSVLTGTATDVPLIVKGAVSQTAHLLSARDSSNTELLFIEPNGNLNAKQVTATAFSTPGAMSSASISTGTIASSARVSAVGFDGLGTSNITPNGTGNNGLVLTSPTGSTASPIVVRDAATSSAQAGVGGETSGFRLYHGGIAGNYVPLLIHGGTVNMTIGTGSFSDVATIDLSSFGFTQSPIFVANAFGNTTQTNRYRVAVMVYARSATSVSIRCFQTEGAAISGADASYTVMWMAMQYASGSAAG